MRPENMRERERAKRRAEERENLAQMNRGIKEKITLDSLMNVHTAMCCNVCGNLQTMTQYKKKRAATRQRDGDGAPLPT